MTTPHRVPRTDPEPFDGLEPDGPPVDRRWDAYRIGLLCFASGATLGLLCLIPAWPDDAPTAPVVRRSTFDRRPSAAPAVTPTDWSTYDPASGIDPALVARPVPVPVNEAPEDAMPEPPLRAIEGAVSSRAGEPRGGAR